MLKYHEDTNFNYQMNRAVYLDGGREVDIRKIASGIQNCQDWKKAFIKIGDEAVAEKRLAHASAYYRMSEFFMFDGDPDKKKYYELSIDFFYQTKKTYFESKEVLKTSVPFEEYELPILYKKNRQIRPGR